MTGVRTTITIEGGDVVSHYADVSGAGLQPVGKHRSLVVNVQEGASGRWAVTSEARGSDARSYGECETLDNPLEPLAELNLVAWLGQSNARGSGDNTFDYVPDSDTDGRRHFYCLAGAWGSFDTEPLHKVPALDSVQSGPGDGGFSSALRTIEQLCLARPGEHWGAIGAAVGGTSLADWAQSTNRTTVYGHAWARIRGALRRSGTVLRAIVWYQGEADAQTEVAANAYAATCQAIFDAMRTDLAMPDLPIIIVRIRSDGPGAFTSTVRAQQATLAQASPPQIVIDAPEGAGTLADTIHLNSEGQNALADLIVPEVVGVL